MTRARICNHVQVSIVLYTSKRGSPYRSLLCTLVAIETFSFPPIWRQVANEIASSMACVAPLPDDGRNVCALSPTCTTLPLPGETQFERGSRHMISQSIMPSAGVHRIKRLATSGKLGMVEVRFRTVESGMGWDQDSRPLPVLW